MAPPSRTPADAISLPFEEAISFFRGKARMPTEAWSDVWREAHARSFMVAGATNDALLKDFQAAIQKALSEGTAYAEFRKTFDHLVKKYGWAHTGAPGWRASIIYDTNLTSAYSAGRYVQATDPDVLRAFPYWQYRHTSCAHPRLLHLAWDGLTLRADDPWWDTHYPPNGWRCGCRVSAVSDGGLRRMGKRGPDQAPPLVTKPWVNPRTGEVHQVPAGIDPGFDWNPGKAWKEGLGAEEPMRASPLRPTEREPTATRAQLDAIARFVARPDAPEMPIGTLGKGALDAFEVTNNAVVLPAQTVRQGKRAASPPSVADYQLLPLLLGEPALGGYAATRPVLFAAAGGGFLRAELLLGRGGEPHRVLRVRRLDAEGLRRALSSLVLLFGAPGALLP